VKAGRGGVRELSFLLKLGGSKMAWSVGEKKSEAKRGAPGKVSELRPSADASSEMAGRQEAKGRGRDLAGGMEILELEFLLSIVESTGGDNKNDVMMRKLNFDELYRREQLNEIDSGSLKVYAKDAKHLYGKDIQCQAMNELTIRTTRKSKQGG
jgi:hypothetical protein